MHQDHFFFTLENVFLSRTLLWNDSVASYDQKKTKKNYDFYTFYPVSNFSIHTPDFIQDNYWATVTYTYVQYHLIENGSSRHYQFISVLESHLGVRFLTKK